MLMEANGYRASSNKEWLMKSSLRYAIILQGMVDGGVGQLRVLGRA